MARCSRRSQSAARQRRTTPQTRICHRSTCLPQAGAGAAGGLFAGADLGGEQGENLGFEGRVRPEPLEAGQKGRELVTAVERQVNLFDGDGQEAGLAGKGVAHKG